jgi:superfamily II DNA or RNA helicase
MSKQAKKPVFFICHRQELLTQTSKTFDENGIPHSFIAAGLPYRSDRDVYLCSIDTLKRRLDRVVRPALCIWDEAHHIGAAGWAKVQDCYHDAYHVGLSATPERLDGKGLDQWFDSMVMGPSVQWLIANKHLSDYRLFAPSVPDLTGVHTRMGDFKQDELQAALDASNIIGDSVKSYRKYAAGRLAVVFCCNRRHAAVTTEAFKSAGIPAAYVDGETPKAERKEIIRQFADGEIKVLVNVALFTEGFDLAAQAGKDVTIECVIMLRPTQSLSLHLQMVGRALRKKDYPAIILDHAGNTARHGLPDDEREWSLTGRKGKGRQSDEKDVLIKQCEKCFHVFRPAPKCPCCGYIIPINAREIETVDGELVEIDKEALRKKARKEQGSAQTLEELIALGKSRKYSPGWAYKVHASRQRKRRSA